MSIAELAKRQYYNDSSSTNYTTIIVVIVVIFVLKICLIAWLCHYRNKKRRERRAKGCTCYSDTDYYCLPWWYWSSDKRCHCGALNNSIYNAPRPQQPPSYSSGPNYNAAPGYAPTNDYNAAPPYPATQYTSSPQAEAGQWNAQQQSTPLKPPQSARTNGHYY